MELAFDPAILLLGLYPKYHNFLIHSFTTGHLGCFQHLAIVNCAAMNIGVHRFFWIENRLTMTTGERGGDNGGKG